MLGGKHMSGIYCHCSLTHGHIHLHSQNQTPILSLNPHLQKLNNPQMHPSKQNEQVSHVPEIKIIEKKKNMFLRVNKKIRKKPSMNDNKLGSQHLVRTRHSQKLLQGICQGEAEISSGWFHPA